MRKLQLQESISPIRLFLAVSMTGILAFFTILVPKYGMESFRWLVMEHNWSYQFADYYRPVIVAKDLSTVYTNGVTIPYPPLAFLIFHLLWRLGPTDIEIPWNEWLTYEAYQYSLLTFFMFTIVTIVLMFMFIRRLLVGYKDSQVCIFSLLILFSAPFYQGVIERGNIAILSLVMLLFSICFRDSKSKIMRELSLIFIAIAAGIKIYPAVFGLLYLKEKRWVEAMRLIGYGLAFFFLPFLFTGGISGFFPFLGRLQWFNGKVTVGQWTSIQPFLASACDYLSLNWNTKTIGKIIEILFVIVSISLFFIERNQWKSTLYLCGIMTVCGARIFRYNAIFMLIPLLLFLVENKEKSKYRKTDYVYSLLFASIYTIPIWAIHREVDFAIFFPIYVILLIGIIETITHFIKCRLKNM